jgi:hypothetical protein
LNGPESATLDVEKGRRIYAHVARGAIVANGIALDSGDALKVTDGVTLTLVNGRDSEVIVFDLP